MHTSLQQEKADKIALLIASLGGNGIHQLLAGLNTRKWTAPARQTVSTTRNVHDDSTTRDDSTFAPSTWEPVNPAKHKDYKNSQNMRDRSRGKVEQRLIIPDTPAEPEEPKSGCLGKAAAAVVTGVIILAIAL